MMANKPPAGTHREGDFASPGAVAGVSAAGVVGRYRWVICALIFLATTVNYVDRQVIGLLKPTLQRELGWSEIDYSNIVFWFQTAYAVGLLFLGRLIDRLGTRIGYSLSLIVWSVAAMAHAGVRSVVGFSMARAALGLGESGNFPAAIKAVAEWVPKKERALATSLFNSGTNIGALVVPVIVPWLTLAYGWQAAFLATGALGFLWLALWLPLYGAPERHPRVSQAELAYIQSDPPDVIVPISMKRVLRHREAWAFAVAKFLTDPVWWLYLFWVPDFLYRNHGLNLAGASVPLVIIYTAATIGSIGAGWLSGAFIKRGWRVSRARRTAMLLCAVAVVPIMLASQTRSLWAAVALLGLATACHQGWSANLFTTASDLFPRRAVGSVVGFGGMAGAVGGMLISKITGYVLQATGSYFVVFVIAGSAYLVAFGIFHLLTGSSEGVSLDEA